MKNLYGQAAQGYDGGSSKINIGGINYGRNWNEEDQAHYDLYLKSLEFDQNRMLQLDEREYNSPAAQAARMREAGLNPDLQGISPDQSPSMSIASPTAPAGESRTDRVLKISSIAQAFLQSIPEVIGAFTQSKSMIQQNQMTSLNLAEKYDSLALNVLGDSVPKEVFSKDSSGHEFWKSYDPSVDVERYFGGNLSRVQKRRISSSIDRLVSGNMERLRSQVYGNYSTAESNRKSFIDLLGSFGFSVDDDVFLETVREFNRIQAKASKSKNNYELSYWTNRDGISSAQADNKDVENRSLKADNNIFAEGFSRANELLESEKRGDQVKGLFLYFALAFTQSKLNGLQF